MQHTITAHERGFVVHVNRENAHDDITEAIQKIRSEATHPQVKVKEAKPLSKVKKQSNLQRSKVKNRSHSLTSQSDIHVAYKDTKSKAMRCKINIWTTVIHAGQNNKKKIKPSSLIVRSRSRPTRSAN